MDRLSDRLHRKMAEKVEKLAVMTHKDRVHEFNSKLEALSEHHDIPKVRLCREGAIHYLTIAFIGGARITSPHILPTYFPAFIIMLLLVSTTYQSFLLTLQILLGSWQFRLWYESWSFMIRRDMAKQTISAALTTHPFLASLALIMSRVKPSCRIIQRVAQRELCE